MTDADDSLTDRFTSLMDRLFRHVEAEVLWGLLALPLLTGLWRRLWRLKARFAAITARFEAGTLAAPGSARRPGRVRADKPPRLRGLYWQALPRRVGWVVQTISGSLIRADELEIMLEEPEMAATVAAAPQLGRVLRPLCRMLAVKPPAWLRLPRRPRPPRPAPARPRGHWEVVRVGAGEGWTKPDSLWPTREIAQKYDAKIRVWVDAAGVRH